MTKYEFLNIIANGLRDFPKQELQDILYDYEEHFRNGFADEKTDEEIINELGDPYKIVNQYRSQYIQKYDNTSKNNNNFNETIANKVVKVILLVLLAILASKFGLILGFSAPAFIANFPTSVIILLSIGSVAGTILLIILIVYAIKAIIILFKKLINYFRNRGGI